MSLYVDGEHLAAVAGHVQAILDYLGEVDDLAAGMTTGDIDELVVRY